ncbi:MAG: hypothetical protein AAF242_17660 [Bacteroidota bacterium]
MDVKYNELTIDALKAEEKKLKSKGITNAFLIGTVIGVAIWAATHNTSFLLTLLLLILPFRIGRKNAQALASVRAAIQKKSAGE